MDADACKVVSAVDPGTTNFAAWVGKFDEEAGRVSTLYMMHGMPADQTEGKPKKKKKAVYEITADCAELVADMCERSKVEHIIVETAAQWNTPARISAAAAYGVFRGRKLPVSFSGSNTKSKAMLMFAEKLGITDQLETVPEEWNRKDKTVASKIRLMNKRNAVKVVDALLRKSEDAAGLSTFELGSQKHDMADALLLACGGVMAKKKKPRVVRKPRAKKARTDTD